MASQRELILQAIVAALGGVGKPTGLTVHRSRALPIEQDELPSVVVYALFEETSRIGDTEWLPIVDRRLKVRCEVRTKGNPPDQVLDPYLSWVVQTLVSNQKLGGLSDSLHEIQSEWAAVSSNVILGACAQDFEVRYRTQGDDPEDV